MKVHRSHDVEGNTLCNLELGSRSNQFFLVNTFPPKLLDIAKQALQMHRSYDVEDTGQRCMFVIEVKVKVKGEIMYLLANASPPQPLNIATSNFADALASYKLSICDDVPSTSLV